jgi:WD40 repeat protein
MVPMVMEMIKSVVRLAGGQSHSYRIRMATGQYLHGVVDQRDRNPIGARLIYNKYHKGDLVDFSRNKREVPFSATGRLDTGWPALGGEKHMRTGSLSQRKISSGFFIFLFLCARATNGAIPAPGHAREDERNLSTLSACNQQQTPAPQPDGQPILRIETGVHNAPIKRIAIDAGERFLVTGSDDKTVRVWELPSGRLLQILRPPVGEGDEGKVYAVAISPDASTIACGGWTAPTSDQCVYLFDRKNGTIRQRLTGLPNVTEHLAYSADGRFLVASLGSDGIRVYRVGERYEQAGIDQHYGSDSFWADFDSADRLVTASDDSYLRLYASLKDQTGQLVPITKVQAPGGKRPYCIRFSPDGTRIAVGYTDTTSVDVLSATDLLKLYSAATSDVDNGNLQSIAWSGDGKLLFAGGLYLKNGQRPIREWLDSGHGEFRDLPAGSNTIVDLRALGSTRIAFASHDPAFGVMDLSGKALVYVHGDTADFRNNLQSFLVSDDATSIQFSYEPFGRSPVRFSVADRALILNPSSDGTLASAVTDVPDLRVENWENLTKPTVNGRPLLLKPTEICRSLAISPDHSALLLGTEWYLRLFDRSGGGRSWSVPGPGAAWAVNISGNGKLALAAFADGSIRWYSMSDGAELLCFFPHRDQRRWVLWSHSGYYDCSIGGEDLIGWQVNNGPDRAADFFPASRFRATAYRPDVIARILTTLDEGNALVLADKEAGRRTQKLDVAGSRPPLVRILSPADGSISDSPEVPLRFALRSPSGEPITGYQVLVDGRPAANSNEEIRPADDHSEVVREMRVQLYQQSSTLAVVAENRFGVSEDATVRVKWRGPGAAKHAVPVESADQNSVRRTKLYVLAVGVGQAYSSQELPKLTYPAKDASDFVEVMKTQKGLLYLDVEVKLLREADATKERVEKGLDWLQHEVTSTDVAMIFLSGHGTNDRSNRYFYLTANADLDSLLSTAVPWSDIKGTADSLPGKVLFFIDTCHSGNATGAMIGKGPHVDINRIVNELSSAENGVVVFASSTGRQLSLERVDWGNGAFTKALVEGLRGRAAHDPKTVGITITMLEQYISQRVKELTGNRQTPAIQKPVAVPDFPVAIVHR